MYVFMLAFDIVECCTFVKRAIILTERREEGEGEEKEAGHKQSVVRSSVSLSALSGHSVNPALLCGTHSFTDYAFYVTTINFRCRSCPAYPAAPPPTNWRLSMGIAVGIKINTAQ